MIIIKDIKNFLNKYFFQILIFTAMCFSPVQVFAGDITVDAFKPLLDIIYVVLKVAGAVIALIGFAKLLLSFSNEQPESRYSGVMQILTGMVLFFSDQVLETLGIKL